MPASLGQLSIRGVHIDCRAQMLRFDYLRQVYRDLARWGFNAVLFEYEDRFPYRGKLRRIAASDALTAAHIRDLNRMAGDLGLRVIPLVQCLGHLEYVLRHAAFRRHAEAVGAPGMPHDKVLYAVCPSRRTPLALFQAMASQVLELHADARLFHMGGDEVVLSGRCPRCGPRLRHAGVSAVLMQYYAACAEWLSGHGVQPVMWGDLVLAHPEHLGALRGKVVIMDWDYWSGLRPRDRAVIWGARDADFRKPKTWPKPLGRMFGRYVLTDDGNRARPFPYVRFLRDQGFEVIVASAARSYGDNFCAPLASHLDNVIGAARTAREANVLGSVITSWALRRAPWPLTEHLLCAGAMTMRGVHVSRAALDRAFAKEHFGTAAPALARIPLLLGGPGSQTPYLQTWPHFDSKTGRWAGPTGAEIAKSARRDPGSFLSVLRELKRNLSQAEALLTRARPKTKRQRERVALWRWACDTLSHFAAFGPQLLVNAGQHNVPVLAAFQRDAARLARTSSRLLSRLYTTRTVVDEQRIRFRLHIRSIGQMIAACRTDHARG